MLWRLVRAALRGVVRRAVRGRPVDLGVARGDGGVRFEFVDPLGVLYRVPLTPDQAREVGRALCRYARDEQEGVPVGEDG